LILLFAELYRTNKEQYNKALLSKMQLCSYSMECKEFVFDIVTQENKALNTLYENQDAYAFFYIPQSQKYCIKILYPQTQLQYDKIKIRQGLWIEFMVVSFILLLLAIFMTLYTLRPIRKALLLNDEFIKDILHDFNTPITSILINLDMLKGESQSDTVERLLRSVDTILLLQNNLKSFLHNSKSQKSDINTHKLLANRIEYIQNIYPNITFEFHPKAPLSYPTNEELLTRIIDNLLSNAAKYNHAHGKVITTITHHRITIEDTGKGIENIQKATQRYYKEQSRGVGLGLHIVDKLTQELHIKFSIQSTLGVGTKVVLEFQNV